MLFYKSYSYICRSAYIFFLKKKIFKNKSFLSLTRRSEIFIHFFDFSVRVHSGQHLKRLVITELQRKKKVGEFAFTRKPYFFPLRKKKK